MRRDAQDQPSVMTQGLTGWGARGLAGLYAVTHIALASISGEILSGSPIEIGALALMIGAVFLMVLPGKYPLHPASAATVCGVVLLAAVSVTVLLPGDGRWPGYSSWQFGAITFALVALSLRGRTRLAWATMAGVILIIVGWSVATDQGAAFGLNLLVRQVGLLAVGSAFAVAFERADRRLRHLADARRRSAALQHAADIRVSERIAEAGRLVAIAAPAFARIRASTVPTDDVRREYLAIEAALRDAIRARGLSVEPLVASARAARLRGVTVLLLDDAQRDLDEGLARTVATWIADLLDEVDDGAVTARLTLADGGAAVSVVGDDALGHSLDEHRTFLEGGGAVASDDRRIRSSSASDASYAG
jgi:hypothetical protein